MVALVGVIVVLLMIGGAGLGGYKHGYGKAEGDAAKRYQIELAAAIAAERETTVIDMQAAAEAERSRAAERIVYVDKVRTVTETVYANPTNCPLPVGYQLRVNDLVDKANGRAAPSKPESLPAPPTTQFR